MNTFFGLQNRQWHPPLLSTIVINTRSTLMRTRVGSSFLLISVLLLLLSLTSCSSSGIKGVVEPPKIQVHKVEMGSFNLSGGNATFILDITNPNRFSIPLNGFNYGLKLNGVEVAKGVKEHKVTIRGGQSYKMAIPLSFSFTNMVQMLPDLLRSRKLNYDVGGSVHLPWFNIPFNRSGSANLK